MNIISTLTEYLVRNAAYHNNVNENVMLVNYGKNSIIFLSTRE
jgi:hypothetical protein